MGDMRLNFNQPLLSVRRGSSTIAEIDKRKSNNTPPTSNTELLNSGHIRNPSLIPFLWEQIPGKPKDDDSSQTEKPTSVDSSPSSKPQTEHDAATVSDTPQDDDGIGKNRSFDESDDSNYLDALDTLSRSDSFLNCSLSGLSGSGFDHMSGARSNGTCLSSDQDLMLGRFLNAAKTVASDKPQLSRKSSIVVKKEEQQPRDVKRIQVKKDSNNNNKGSNHRNYCLREKLLSYYNPQDNDDDDDGVEEEEDFTRKEDFSATKLCGLLLPRFCLLNPVSPGLRDPAPVTNVTSFQSTQKKKYVNYVAARIKSENKAIAEAVYERRRLLLHQRSKHRFANIAGSNLKTDPKKQLLLLPPFEMGSIKLDELLPASSKQLICVGKSGGSNVPLPYRNRATLRSHGTSLMEKKEKGFLGIPEPRKVSSSWPVKRSSSTRNARFREVVMHQGNITDEPPPSTATCGIVKTLYIDSAASDCQDELCNSSSSESRSDVMDSRRRNPSIDYSLLLQGMTMSDDVLCVDDKPPPVSQFEVKEENKLNEVLRLTEGGDCQEEEMMSQDMRLILAQPPLPKSPSESWLARALPAASGSSRHAHSRSFLGVGNMGFRPALTTNDSQLKMQ